MSVRELALRVEVAPGVRLHACLYEPTSTSDAAAGPSATSTSDAAATTGQPPFLLVHGLASNALLWRGVGRRLAAAGHRAVAVDQRSHGRSDQSDELDLETLTGDLVTVASAVGLDRPIAVGQSWGGNVVLDLGWRHPDQVRAVVCLDGGTIELSRSFPDWEACWAALAPPHWDERRVSFADLLTDAARRGAVSGWPEEGWQAQLGNLTVRADGTVAAILTRARHERIVRGLWEHRPTSHYPDIPVPVLLLPVDTGEAGWTAGKRAGTEEAVAALPRSRTVWFHDRDHDVHAQTPDEVAAVLLEAVHDGFLTGGST